MAWKYFCTVSVLCLILICTESLVEELYVDSCPHGETFRAGCYHCICNPESGKLICTPKYCIVRKDKCPRGVHFSDICVQCTCDPKTGINNCDEPNC